MKNRESNGMSDYIYYPIEYPSMVLTNIATMNILTGNSVWIISIDKSKFISGSRDDDNGTAGDPTIVNTISIGF